MYELKAFGGLRLFADGILIDLPRRRLAVLAVLARAGTPGLQRDRVVGLLWPDSAPGDGRHSLEQVLSALRGRLGPDLFLGPDPVRLDPAMIVSDVGRFFEALAGNDLERAALVCDGPFLDGFRLPGAWEFEEWVERERRSIHDRHLEVLAALAETARAAGDIDAAVDWWRRAAERDPFRTTAALGLMRALAARGDRIPAIQHANLYEKLIRGHLELEPDAAVVALRDELERSPEGFPAPVSSMPSAVAHVEQVTVDVPDTPAPAVPLRARTPASSRVRRLARHWAVGAVLLVVTVVSIVSWLQSGDAAHRIAALAPSDPRPTLAVLPFEDLSADPAHVYFTDGMTEELITTLARVRQIRVMARQSAAALPDTAVDFRSAGDRLGVAYFLVGSVRRSGDHVRIAARLVSARDGALLWSDQYDRPLADVFRVQTEIALAITAALTEPLGLAEAERLVTTTDNLEAYDLYLEGRARLKERGPSVAAAVELFEAALARDSGWAPAWAGLAEARALSIFYEESLTGFYNDSAFIAGTLARAQDAAERALALDPANTSAAVALAGLLRDTRRWDEAERAYLRALSLDPDNVEAHQQYAELLNCVGRQREALESARRALRLERSPIRLNVAGWFARENGLWDEAIDLLTEGIRLDTAYNLPALRANLRGVYFAQGRWREGRELWLSHARRMSSSNPALRPSGFAADLERAWPDTALLPPAALAEMFAEPIDVRARYRVRPGASIRPIILRQPFQSSYFWMVRGEADRALADLAYLEEGPFGCFDGWLWGAAFDPLRGDPRFEKILREIDLEPRWPDRAADATPNWPSRRPVATS